MLLKMRKHRVIIKVMKKLYVGLSWRVTLVNSGDKEEVDKKRRDSTNFIPIPSILRTNQSLQEENYPKYEWEYLLRDRKKKFQHQKK